MRKGAIVTTIAGPYGTSISQKDHERLQATAHRRLNVGSGPVPIPYWTNLDESPNVPADIRQHVPPIPFDNETLDEIYAGHVIEHMTRPDAVEFLKECHRCLVPGGRIGVLVPDTREIVLRYLRGDIDEIEFPHGQWWKIRDLDAVPLVLLLDGAGKPSPMELR
jgi:predicted SAM-dependent methyltransferase